MSTFLYRHSISCVLEMPSNDEEGEALVLLGAFNGLQSWGRAGISVTVAGPARTTFWLSA
jgi:anti-sigma factor RsiW